MALDDERTWCGSLFQVSICCGTRRLLTVSINTGARGYRVGRWPWEATRVMEMNNTTQTQNIVHRSRPRLRHLSLSTFDVDGSYVTTTMAFFFKLAQNCDILLRQVIEDRVTIMIISIR